MLAETQLRTNITAAFIGRERAASLTPPVEPDSRVILTTRPTDARDPYVLETPYGRVNLHQEPTIAALLEASNPYAARVHYRNRVKHEGRHYAGEQPSTVQQTIIYTQQRAEQGTRFDQAAQRVTWLSQLMKRMGLDPDRRRQIWNTVIQRPETLPAQVQNLTTQVTRARK